MKPEDAAALVTACLEEGMPYGKIVKEIRECMDWAPCPLAVEATLAGLKVAANEGNHRAKELVDFLVKTR